MSDQAQNSAGSGPLPMPVVRSEHYFNSYANGFSFRVSTVDFAVTFLQNSNPVGSSSPVLFENGSVSMSLPVMKQLAMSLSTALTALEEVFGPIKVDASTKMTPAHVEALIGPLRAVNFEE